MPRTFVFFSGIALAAVSGAACNPAGQNEPSASATLLSSSGEQVGKAEFVETKDGVMVTIEARGLPPGEHAVHVHETGACVAPDFESAGGHFAPDGFEHGLARANAEAHAGDLTNLVVDDEGNVETHRVVLRATLQKGRPAESNSLLREGGTALVIHEKADDYRTDPAGAAGSRIACGIIEAS